MYLTHKYKKLIIAFFLLSFQLVIAQQNGIVVDKETVLPIPYVSIHTTLNNGVLASMSNESGKYHIAFEFDSLVFTHINYASRSIHISQLTDTIYLQPTAYTLNEVDVFATEAPWIRKKLQQVLKRKNELNIPRTFQQIYTYQTYTLSDSSGYSFSSNGLLSQANKQYSISPFRSVVKYKDNTAGTDFTNLRRILYDDFIGSFSNRFIKENTFSHNQRFSHPNKNVVQVLYYKADNQSDDGYLLIDTLTNLLLEAQQNIGTKSNIKNNTSAMLLKVAESRGFTYNDWITQTKHTYEVSDGFYRLQSATYKLYMATRTENKKQSSRYFVSTESQVELVDNDAIQSNKRKFLVLPEPYYIVPIYTKKMRLEEEQLQNIEKKYERF